MICLLLAPFLATTLFHRPYLTALIRDVSFIILAQSLVATATAAFTGVEQMHVNSLMIVSQAIVKTVLAPALVLIGLGLYGAIVGYSVSYFATVLIGLLLVWTIYKSLPSLPSNKLDFTRNIKLMLRFGLPLGLSDILGGFLMQFYSFILAIYVANNALIGNFSLASNFVIIVTFVATPINTMLFPAFSKIDCKNDNATLKKVFQSSVKYTTLLTIPIVGMLIALSKPGVSTLFANHYAQAPFYIGLLALNYVFLAFGMYSTTNLINTQDRASIKILLAVMTLAVGLPLGFVLISHYGVVGMLVTLIFDGTPSVVIGLVFVKKQYNLTIDWLASGKILFSSSAAGLFSYLVVKLPVASVIQLVIGIPLFLLTFVAMIILTRTLSPMDMSNFHMINSDLAPLAKIVNPLLDLLEKIDNAVNHRENKVVVLDAKLRS